MTLLDDVKLLTTANASKVGTLYSIKPDNGNGDLDITRSTTATRVNPSGLIETVAINEPQIDYTDGCGSFWVESISTNIHLYSEELDNAAYTKSDVTVSANAVTSPDGTTNADECETTTNSAQMYQTISLATATTYTWSFYVKRGTMTDVGQQIFNMDGDGEYGTSGSYYSQTTASGWTRVSFTFTTGIQGGTTRFYPINASGVSGTIYLWGFQLEQHTIRMSMESSYIPTTSAVVTRNMSVFDKTGLTSTIGSTEGVLFCEMAMFWNGTGTPSSRQKMMGWKNADGRAILGSWGNSWFCWLSGAGGNAIFSMSPVITETSFVKMAVKYKAGDHAYWKDGVEIATSTNATAVSATQDRIVGSYDGISDFWAFYGKIKTIQVYDTALTDAQLLALTT